MNPCASLALSRLLRRGPDRGGRGEPARRRWIGTQTRAYNHSTPPQPKRSTPGEGAKLRTFALHHIEARRPVNDYLIDQPELLGLLGRQELVPLHRLFDHIEGLTCMFHIYM